MLMALSSFLSKDELNRMVNTLPDELDYIRQPGIANLFPEPINHLLGKSNDLHTSFPLTENRRNIIADAPNERTMLGTDNSHDRSFEETLSDIIQCRSLAILSNFKQSVTKKLCSSFFYILQGGDISNSILLKTVGVTTLMTSVTSYHQFGPITRRIIKPIDHCCKILSVGCGSILLLRELHSLSTLNRNDSSNRSILVPKFFTLYKFLATWLIEAKIKICNDSIVASFCLVSCALSVILGYRLHVSNFKDIKWIYDIFLSRLIQYYKNIILKRE